MKKTVWTFGLISGAVVSLMMCITTYIGFEKIGFENGEILGYSTMILALSFVFFGIRSYRENVSGGTITFGKAFRVGIFIALISSLCYVICWMIISTFFHPEFMDEYTRYYIEKQKETGVTGEKLDKVVKEMEYYKTMYKNPFIKFGMTFLEIFPVGLIVTLISAAILRKRQLRITN